MGIVVYELFATELALCSLLYPEYLHKLNYHLVTEQGKPDSSITSKRMKNDAYLLSFYVNATSTSSQMGYSDRVCISRRLLFRQMKMAAAKTKEQLF